MQAIILAAGMGKRLKELTQNNTKCMIRVNEETLIERALYILDRKGLSQIVLVVGYEGKKLMDYVNELFLETPVRFIENTIYNKTNNIYSLALAKEYLTKEDSLILESDLIFEEAVIDQLLQDERETLALVDKFENWMDGTCMVLDEEDSICEFISGKYLKFSEKENYYKTVNIYKFSKHFSENVYVPFLEAYKTAMGNNEYYESVIKLIAMLDTKEIRAKRLNGQIWYEIDDIQDLDIAESLFTPSEKKYEIISKRYGGYWRYPKMLDFCYLVNPYYPTQKMLEEIKSNFETLLRQYPSGLNVNSLLAAKNFGVKKEYIVVGNGAAELINVLIGMFKGKIGFIKPTFEEYPNRYDEKDSVYMTVSDRDFRYSAEDIISYYEKNPIDALVLINPDNPSGNYINILGVKRLISWCRERKIKFVLDESFVDFVDSDCTVDELTLVTNKVLESYEDGLFIVKSISKSYGIPGARLGILATANQSVMQTIKERVSIWNINSFGEYYMQIAEKYKKDYVDSLEKIKDTRAKFFQKLARILWIRVMPSQANYIMCELVNGVRADEVACYLLDKNILIKDLTKKIKNGKQYIRLAVRKEEENDYLIQCLNEYKA